MGVRLVLLCVFQQQPGKGWAFAADSDDDVQGQQLAGAERAGMVGHGAAFGVA